MPRGGGLGVILGAAAGLALAGVGLRVGAGIVLLGALAVVAVGLWDDRRGVAPLARLGVHTVVAAVLVVVVGGLPQLPLPPPLDLPLGDLGVILAVVWVVAVVNFYNFLDGIDGLAGVQAVVTGGGVALAAWNPFAGLLAAVLAAASFGFLLHNWPPARIFLGDVGSGVLGFSFAAAPLLAPPTLRPAAVLFVGVSLFLFLADATYTLLARLRRGERLHEAHREHLYQRLVIAGWSHARVSLLLGLGGLVLTGLALVAWHRAEPAWAWAALAVCVSAFAGEMVLVRRTEATLRGGGPF